MEKVFLLKDEDGTKWVATKAKAFVAPKRLMSVLVRSSKRRPFIWDFFSTAKTFTASEIISVAHSEKNFFSNSLN